MWWDKKVEVPKPVIKYVPGRIRVQVTQDRHVVVLGTNWEWTKDGILSVTINGVGVATFFEWQYLQVEEESK